ncbi:MAG: 3-hydroxyacyl-ACP dehydratase FabZ [Armatimonadetes bacterium]|nr:3-hydroxyacyl-ACP dehydratase FabZ [Armatimonadota bacterium]
MLTIDQICEILPHRYPFLLVDRILELEPGKRAVGLKNVSANEEFFQGHFPGYPVMPGVLIIESMAQVGGVLLLAMEEYRGRLAFFAGVDKVKFRHTVLPGDTLVTEAEIIRIWATRGVGIIRTVGKVDGKLVAEAEMKFALKDVNTSTAGSLENGEG